MIFCVCMLVAIPAGNLGFLVGLAKDDGALDVTLFSLRRWDSVCLPAILLLL